MNLDTANVFNALAQMPLYSLPRYKKLVSTVYLYITNQKYYRNLNTSCFLGIELMPVTTRDTQMQRYIPPELHDAR